MSSEDRLNIYCIQLPREVSHTIGDNCKMKELTTLFVCVFAVLALADARGKFMKII